MSGSYELAALPLAYRSFWEDAQHRHHAIASIADALGSELELPATVEYVDHAIVAGLSAVGLPRGPVRDVRIENSWSGWRGRKRPDCLLLISGHDLQEAVRRERTDTVLRTWIHESLHARLPFSLTAHAEYVAHRGYEEGLAESLTRIVLDRMAIPMPLRAFEYYVEAYRALAAELGISHEVLCRRLWYLQPGRVRAGMIDAIAATTSAGAHISIPRFMSVADQLLNSSRQNDHPDIAILRTTWKLALS